MSTKQIRINTSIKVKLDNCATCLLCWKGHLDRPSFCNAIPNMLDSKYCLNDVRQIDENGNYSRTPPDWCPLRRGKVIIEGEDGAERVGDG